MSPQPDDEADRVVDPAVLAERRARRLGRGPSEEELVERATRAERAVAGLEERLSATEERLRAAQAERAELAARVRAAAAGPSEPIDASEATPLRMALADAVVRAGRLEEELVRTRAELAAAREEADAARVGAATAAARAEELEGRRDGAEVALAEAHADLARARGRVAELEGALAEATAARDLAEDERDASRLAAEEVAGHRERVAALAGALAEAEASRDEARAEAAARAAELRAAHERLGATQLEAEGRAAAGEAERAGLVDRLRVLEAELAEARGAAALAAADAARAAAAAHEDRGARERAEAALAARESADAERDGVVAELVTTTRALREAYDAELAALAAVQAAPDPDAVAAVQARIDALGDQLRTTLADLRGRLAAERSAREVAEAALAAVEEGAAGEPEPPVVPLPSLPDDDVPAADHPALTRAADAAGVPPAVVADLAGALERLRATQAPVGADAVAEDGPPVVEDVERTSRLEPVATAAERASGPWLDAALAALAERDADAAGRVLLALLPVQAARAREELTYALTVGSRAPRRVVVAPGRVRAEPAAAGDEADADVRIAGSPGVLAALVAGGARRRLRGAEVGGSRRRLRRLLRALREPTSLEEAEAAGARPAPADLLALLATRLRPTPDDAEPRTLCVDLGGAGAATLVLDPGAAVAVREGREEGATATLRPATDALAAALAGHVAVEVEGDARVAAELLERLRAAQRLEG